MSALLELDGVGVRYGGVAALDDVSFAVDVGEIVGLIGPNGAGKTTLIDAVSGYTSASSGTVRFAGDNVTRKRSFKRARMGLGRTFQTVELFDDLTVLENAKVAVSTDRLVASIPQVLRRPDAAVEATARAALEVCEMSHLADHYPGELSHGQRKLAGVARAVARRPKLLCLDEPAGGLDTEESLELGRRLRRLAATGMSLLLVDHDMGLVLETCDRVVVLDFGRVIAVGPPTDVRADRAVISAYLGESEESS
jgi:branched-chain amino acid transport system ATP-binding protein